MRRLIPILLVIAAPTSWAQENFHRELSLGMGAFYKDRIEEAFQHWEKSLEHRPEFAETAKRIAQGHARLGDIDKALFWLEQAAAWNGQFAIELPALADFDEVRARPAYAEVHAAFERNRERALDALRSRALEQRGALERTTATLMNSNVAWLDGHPDPRDLEFAVQPGGDLVVTLGKGGAWIWHSRLGEIQAYLGLVSDTNAKRAEFSPGGEYVLIFDGEAMSASVFHSRTGDPRLTLDQLVRCADFLDEEHLATVDEEGALHIWDLRDRTVRACLSDVPSYSVEGGPDGQFLTLDQDGACRIRDGATGSSLGVLAESAVPHSRASFLEDGRIVTGDDDGSVRLWTWEQGAVHPPKEFPGNAGFPWFAGAFGEERLVRYPGALVSPFGDRLVRIGPGVTLWDTESGEHLGVLMKPPTSLPRMAFVGEMVVVTQGRHADVSTFRADDGELLGKFQRNQMSNLGALSDGRILFSGPGGFYVLSGGTAMVELCGHAMSQRTIELDQEGRVFTGANGLGGVASPGYGPWTPLPRARAVETVRAWDPVTGRQHFGSADAGGRIGGFVRLPERGVVALGEKGAFTFEGPVGHSAGEGPTPTKAAVGTASADGERLALACDDTVTAQLWSELLSPDAAHGRKQFPGFHRPYVDTPRLCAPVFSKDDSLLFTSQGNKIGLWDPFTGDAVAEFEGHTNYVCDLEYSPDRELLLSASADGTARLWPMTASQTVVLEGHQGPLLDSAFHPSGRSVATAGGQGDHTVRLWHLDGREVWVGEGHSGPVGRVEFSPDGNLLLSCSKDGTAKLWNVEDGRCVATLVGHTAMVSRGIFFGSGARVVTHGHDGTQRVWEVPSGRLLATHVEYVERAWLTFTPEGYYVAGGQAAEWARIRKGDEVYPLSSYAVTHERPDKVAASLAGDDVGAPPLLPAPEVSLTVDQGGVVYERKVHVEGFIQCDDGVEAVEVRVSGHLADGTEVPVSRLPDGLVQSGLRELGTSRLLDLEVPIPDEWTVITIRVRATSSRGIRSRVASLHRKYETPTADLYFVGLGVQDYADDSLDLQYPRNDVASLVEQFQSQEGSLYGKVHVRTFLDDEVTGPNLRRAGAFLEEAGPDDTILVFVAGHGVVDKRDKYHFLTPTASPQDLFDGIESRVLRELVENEYLEPTKRVLFIDTCQAAGVTRGVGLGTDAFEQEEVEDAFGLGLYIFAASTQRGSAREADGNGLFTRGLLEGLRGEADYDEDGNVRIDELLSFTTRFVEEESGGTQTPTTPKVEADRPFVLARIRD